MYDRAFGIGGGSGDYGYVGALSSSSLVCPFSALNDTRHLLGGKIVDESD
jgi:hypothetical protein